MGHRLTKIYTRTGDCGETGLGDGQRVAKDHPRIEAIGEVDELNSAIGLLLANELPAALSPLLIDIQHDLFDLGGELSMPGYTLVSDGRVDWLEQQLDQLNETLPPLKEFILPAGGQAAAHCHMARTLCRRAERRVATLARGEPVNPPLTSYLNRLSDLLFVLARVLARSVGAGEVYWQSSESRTA